MSTMSSLIYYSIQSPQIPLANQVVEQCFHHNIGEFQKDDAAFDWKKKHVFFSTFDRPNFVENTLFLWTDDKNIKKIKKKTARRCGFIQII